ncbi:MAG: ankyrin repeat domain-containing protein [Fimbriimonadaceae bacterium]
MGKRQVRFVLWTVMVGVLAAAWATPRSSAGAGANQGPTRKTTDPPVASHGKLGQDLFLAIDQRDAAALKALLNRGADPNSVDGLEITPLDIAAASYEPDAVQALLKAGAKPDADSSYGTPLMFAAASGNVDAANVLLARGVNVGAARNDGMTVLMMAANSGSPEFVGMLLKHKVEVEAKDDGGATALTLAARGGYDKIGQMLLDAGAHVDDPDVERHTPLMAAAMNGQVGFVKMLLKHGANPNARDAKGRTALILTAEYGDYPAVIHALKAAGADVRATDPTGASAAAFAAKRKFAASEAELGKPTRAAVVAVGPTRSPHNAARVSLKLLQASMSQFHKMTACVSCHQEGLGQIATGEARQRGFALAPSVDRAQAKRIDATLAALQPINEAALHDPEAMKQVPLIELNEVNTTDGWLLAGLAAHHAPRTQATAAMAMVLARQQSPDGHWSFSTPRVPMQSSNVTFTALAIRALKAYGPASSAGQIWRAKTWLLHTPAATSEDRASRLLGLKWAGASKATMRKAVEAVKADQRPDGGWSQLPTLQSDAYATGQALYALHAGGGLSVTNRAYTRGVRFLLRTQDQDGSWFVNKRAIPANNYFDAGFPHGESQYASFNGTCWATIALADAAGAP